MSESGSNDQHGASHGEPNAVAPISSPGAQLAAYREERGWSVEQVASQLNLAPRQIVAIESGDYAALPGTPIIRGFIRSYAKLLKVDATPLLAVVGGETAMAHNSIAPMATLATPFSETRLPTMMDRPGLSSKWIVGLLVIVLAVVALWAARRTGEISELSRASTSRVAVELGLSHADRSGSLKSAEPGSAAVPLVNSAKVAGSEPPKGNVPQSPAVAAVQAPAAPETPAASAVAPAVPAPSEATVVPVTAPAPANAAPAAPDAVAKPATNDALVFSAHADSWVEVKRKSDNKVLLARVMKTGETERVDIGEPVSVVVGNVAGIEARLRGQPLDVKGSSSNNVARLTLK